MTDLAIHAAYLVGSAVLATTGMYARQKAAAAVLADLDGGVADD